MPSIAERVRSFLGLDVAKSAQTKAPYAQTVGSIRVLSHETISPAGTRMLRNFANRSEAVRTAINWRKQQVSQARWRIVRIDDPKAPPNPRVVATANRLFHFVNPKRESMRSLFDQIVEDLIVLDAGCIEKEKTLGGRASPDTGCPIAALWAVDGSTIAPDPTWDGHDPKAIRYRQYLDGREVAQLRNDQLVYMMQTPTTYRVLGLSQVEVLVRTIEASLFGEKYGSELLRHAAPPGMLYLGGGINDQQTEAFREYYRKEIAGSGEMAILGGGGPAQGQGQGPQFIRFAWSPRDLLFDEYREWLINVISFVFQIDKTIFGLVDDVNRSTSRTMSARTDQGFVSLARLVAEFITREIISEIDDAHGFEFTDLTVTDPLIQAKIDQTYATIGVLTPNEIRAERFGLDPVEWGDAPYNATGSATPDPLSGDQPENDETAQPSSDETEQDDAGSAKSVGPFGATGTSRSATARQRRASETFSPPSTWPSALG